MTDTPEREPAPVAEPERRPLVVDLDGTLLNSDMLAESFFALLAAKPVAALRSLLVLRYGRGSLKTHIAERARVDLDILPWNLDFIAYLRRQRESGRRIYLASASAKRLVDAVASHLGLFDGVFATDTTVNLKSRAKAEALCRAFGEGGFDYAGNERADLAVWQRAGGVLVVNGSAELRRRVQARWPGALVFGSEHVSFYEYLRAMRLHQWLKNLLVPAPAFAAHAFDLGTLVLCAVAFLSFSLCASSAYVLNDLVDLGRDRLHPTKRRRPLASSRLPVPRGILMFPVLLGLAIVLALLVRPAFVAVLAAYYGLTLAYSFWLKRELMIDVVALACLYGLRLVAGGVAAGVELSAWLAAFSLFFFFGLALVKRCTELAGRLARNAKDPGGRAYRVSDLPLLQSLSAASGLTAVLVLALYINSDAVQALYAEPRRLWLICVILIYWIGRILLLTHRGEMHDDPVVFAATDRVSQICLAVSLAVVLISL